MAGKRNKSDNVIRYRNKWKGNVIGYIFLSILIYLVAQLFMFYTKDKISVYELQDEALYSAATDYTGLITRDEIIVQMPRSSYVNYTVREGKRASAGAVIYTTVSADTAADTPQEAEQSYQLTAAAAANLKTKLQKAAQRDIEHSFSLAYQDKNELQIALIDSIMLSTEASADLNGLRNSQCVRSTQSGYILFRTDSFDGYQPENVTLGCFQEENYSVRIFTGNEKREKGDFAYKLIEDDSFSITFPITQEDAARYRNRKYLQIELAALGVKVNGSFRMFTASDKTTMATVTLNKYGSSYLTERYVDFKIVENDIHGYKIPKSSVISKDFLVVPEGYIVKNSPEGVGVHKEVINEKGEITSQFVKVSVYAHRGSSYYISSSSLSMGDYLYYAMEMKKESEDGSKEETYYVPDTTRRYLIAVSAPLEGVYNVNKGYCIFRQIEILSETNDGNYYIIESKTSFGLSPYDRIILNGADVVENQIIY